MLLICSYWTIKTKHGMVSDCGRMGRSAGPREEEMRHEWNVRGGKEIGGVR